MSVVVNNPANGTNTGGGTGPQGPAGPAGPAGPPYTVTGSTGTPGLITAGTSIPVANVNREMKFIAGNGGPVTMTANPQVAAPTTIGDELVLRGTNDTNSVTVNHGTGLILNGPYVLKNGSWLYLQWDGTNWGEVGRNDI